MKKDKKGAVEAMAAGIIAVILILVIGYFIVRAYPGQFKSGKDFSQWAKNVFDLATGKKALEERLKSEAVFLKAFSKVYNGLKNCVGESGDSCYCSLGVVDDAGNFLVDFDEKYVVEMWRRDSGSFYISPSEFGEKVEGKFKTYLVEKAEILSASGLCVYFGEGKVQDFESARLYRDVEKLILESDVGSFALKGPLRVVRFRGFKGKTCFVSPDAIHDRLLPVYPCKSLNIEGKEEVL